MSCYLHLKHLVLRRKLRDSQEVPPKGPFRLETFITPHPSHAISLASGYFMQEVRGCSLLIPSLFVVYDQRGRSSGEVSPVFPLDSSLGAYFSGFQLGKMKNLSLQSHFPQACPLPGWFRTLLLIVPKEPGQEWPINHSASEFPSMPDRL